MSDRSASNKRPSGRSCCRVPGNGESEEALNKRSCRSRSGYTGSNSRVTVRPDLHMNPVRPDGYRDTKRASTAEKAHATMFHNQLPSIEGLCNLATDEPRFLAGLTPPNKGPSSIQLRLS
jgi:hypothetical protein